ncbi:DUF305 domain-containing protein [Bailinhaonella thermotolerans]|uniref:DUF305 domain-containing protein n=1 Tax=Bailinhaonella thermotolerans TaxID=1070861 RepID=A0A3A4B4I2_9ACTN|nr:DUF305 domain-containing protein [Bailinhaonella thermotolerans]
MPESGPPESEAADSQAPAPRRRVPLAGLVVLIVAAAAFAVFLLRPSFPADASAEAGFSRDMAVHHAQAVEMSFAVRDASTAQDIRTLSYDIIVTQTAQRGMMMGWLQQWGLTQGSGRPPMTWMSGHGHGAAKPGPGTGLMPGMATAEELRRLRSLKGAEAEVFYLQLMIRHHKGGVEMAQAVLRLTDRPEVRALAQGMVNTQQGEITLMTDLLRRRDATP